MREENKYLLSVSVRERGFKYLEVRNLSKYLGTYCIFILKIDYLTNT